MHYQLFIPGGKAQDPQMLVDLGLADLVPGAEFMPNRQGPAEGELGAVVAWRKPGSVGFGYQPQSQTWIPSLPTGPDGEGKGRYWVGFWNDSPVTPEDLQLSRATWGATFELGDGRTWVIPTLREFARDIVRNADTGQWEGTVQTRYHQAHFGALAWWRRFQSEESAPWGEIAEYVEGVLRLNYRLLPEVTNHLRLFNTENVLPLLKAVIGAAVMSEV